MAESFAQPSFSRSLLGHELLRRLRFEMKVGLSAPSIAACVS
uniref:Uncharacterized protein n=1 Tax=Arundo donax TaxID=35708 RepID=A0A0A9A9V5_ARUDO